MRRIWNHWRRYTDSLDGGVHLNEIGAKRVSKHLAQHLKEHYFYHN